MRASPPQPRRSTTHQGTPPSWEPCSPAGCGTRRYDASAGQYFTEQEFNDYYRDEGAQWEAAAAYQTQEQAQQQQEQQQQSRGGSASKRISKFVATNPLMTLPMPGNKKKHSKFAIFNPLQTQVDTAPPLQGKTPQHTRGKDSSGSGDRKTTALTFGNMRVSQAQF